MNLVEAWPRELLRGMSIDKARLFGMPHVGCHYAGNSVNSHKLYRGTRCAVCGETASDAHHEPQKGMGGGKGLPMHGYVLRPALLALCPQCHHDRHFGRLSFVWFWRDEETEIDWASGKLLRDGFKPHDPELFRLGYWVALVDGKPIKRIGD